MIRISFLKSGDKYLQLELEGHANSSKNGQFDVCCAIVSSMVTGCFNSINDDKNYKMTLQDGHALLVVNVPNDVDNARVDTLFAQLTTLKRRYSKFIKIIEI